MNNLIRLKTAVVVGLLVSGISTGYALSETDTTTPTTPDPAATTPVTSTSDNTASDETLKPLVEAKLAPYTNQVKVDVASGVVSLSGQLGSDTDYEKIVTLAESIPGVTDVNADGLTVKDSQAPLTDTYITAKVKGALLESDVMGKDIPTWSVSVETKNGEVFLSGKVNSEQEKQTIVNIAKKVKGVAQVNDQLEVSGTTTPAE